MTNPEPEKPPEAARMPDLSSALAPKPPMASGSLPSTPYGAKAAAPAESAPAPRPRIARGRGEPHRTTAAPGILRPTAEPLQDVRPAPATGPPPAKRTEPIADDLESRRDDAGYMAASRLGGLRNLLVSLGQRSLRKDAEDNGESGLEPRFDRAPVRPACPEAHPPMGDAAKIAAPARLTAQPKFLPPKSVVEVENEKEAARLPATPPRCDNWDGDEIQTLPSRRGQYRKKRYPPM